MTTLIERLKVVVTNVEEDALKAKEEFQGRIVQAVKIHAAFQAQYDFGTFWLQRIQDANASGQTRADSRGVNLYRNDWWYGQALYKLLQEKLDPPGLEVAEIKRYFRRSYIRVSWE